MYTQRLQLEDPSASPFTAGLRVTLYPTIKLGSHWFGYAAIDTRLAPYLYYDAYEPDHEWYTNVIQAFVGYSIRTEKTTVVIKGGQLASAFGSFPLRYDDAENPLLDQPLSYVQTLSLDYGQIPCGVKDLVAQHYGYVSDSCGGAGGGPGLTPVTLYGLPGAEIDFSGHRLDARLQIANSSPAYPQPLRLTGEYLHGWLAAVTRFARDSVSAFPLSADRFWTPRSLGFFRRAPRCAAFQPPVLGWTRNGRAAVGALRENGRDSNTTIPISPWPLPSLPATVS